jgi:hypothetical protein
MAVFTDSWQVMTEGYLASLKTLSLYLPAHMASPTESSFRTSENKSGYILRTLILHRSTAEVLCRAFKRGESLASAIAG